VRRWRSSDEMKMINVLLVLIGGFYGSVGFIITYRVCDDLCGMAALLTLGGGMCIGLLMGGEK